MERDISIHSVSFMKSEDRYLNNATVTWIIPEEILSGTDTRGVLRKKVFDIDIKFQPHWSAPVDICAREMADGRSRCSARKTLDSRINWKF